MIKVTIDAGNGEVVQVECDGVVCGCVTFGKGPTDMWVDTHHGGFTTHDETCRALVAMGAAVYDHMARQVKGGDD